jgi:hypothetical protein
MANENFQMVINTKKIKMADTRDSKWLTRQKFQNGRSSAQIPKWPIVLFKIQNCRLPNTQISQISPSCQESFRFFFSNFSCIQANQKKITQ